MKRAAAADGGVLLLQELGEVALAAGGKAREELRLLEAEMALDLARERGCGSAHQDRVALSGGERRLQPRAQGERCRAPRAGAG